MITVELISYPGDIYIPPLNLWLDPGRVRDRAFVSHAHADHTGRHACIYASLPTSRIMEHRLQVRVNHPLAFGETIPLEKGTLALHPSGHILGAAQAMIEWKGERLVYTGDFKLKPSRTAEPCEVLECDHLVMECTYGRPHYRFPDRDRVEEELLLHIEKLLEREEVPVILAYALGRAQEMIKLLTEKGFPVAAENRICDLCEVYEKIGVTVGSPERFEPEDHKGRVLVFPPHLWKSPVVRNIENRHTIAVTGWAMDGRQKAWYRSDSAFPLSDHADFDDLIRYVELAKPKRISLIHGFKEFAEHLKGMGVELHFVAGLVS